jgi:uncharacterized protein (TIGR02145 family)
MKSKKALRLLCLIIGLTIFLNMEMLSQAPLYIPYQAAIRNANNGVLSNQDIQVRFRIHSFDIDGPIIWEETQSLQTSSLGLINTQLGLNSDLASISWGAGDFFLQIEVDYSNSGNYVEIGRQQLMSVPYALFANESIRSQVALNGISSVSSVGDTLFLSGGQFIIVPGISGANGGSSPVVGSSVCDNPENFNPNLEYGSVTDVEGKAYKTIQIGIQEWMAENLSVKKFSNGDEIVNVVNDSVWSNSNQAAWCYYANDSVSVCPYGLLYNWAVVNDSRNVCPVGWHVPTTIDWLIMLLELDPDSQGNCTGCYYSTSAGGPLKSQGYYFWSPPNANATNSTGFSGLPGGYRFQTAVFISRNLYAYYWTANVNGSNNPYYTRLNYQNNNAEQGTGNVRQGMSIRCVRNQ